uniref:SH3 domain-binding glutamic acid-rich-like protein 3 n=1 Tax=Equus asinus TaxID=9793 RepID=A0A9L0J9F8_EQUAS
VERKCGENLLSGAVPVLVCLLSCGVSHVWVSPEGVGRGSVERGSLAWELQVWKQHKPSKPSCATCSRGSEVGSGVQQTRARLRSRLLPNLRPCPPGLSRHGVSRQPQTVSPRSGEGRRGRYCEGLGSWARPAPEREGGRRRAGRGRSSHAPAARLPAPPIGPESSDSRAEQEGNRSRARRRRLQAVQLPLPPPVRLSARPSTRSMSGLRVYSTSVTGSREIKSQQSEVTRILDGKRIQYQLVDISQDNALRDEMRALAGNPKATPPQIVNGDQYCGDYELFVEAVEQNTLQEFLKLA